MKSIFITGSSGFIGKYLITNFSSKFSFSTYEKYTPVSVNEDVVLHLAGKAHDLKNITNYNEYYEVNTEFTKEVFDAFLVSDAKVFITLSTVKALTDKVQGILTESFIPKPITHYGKSKLLADQYILSKEIPIDKRFYILRPCMIHGPGNKGNLNLLYKFVSKGFPWPLGAFENRRSLCSIDNLCFIIDELIINETIPSGIYNVADDEPLSTNEIIKLIAISQEKKCRIWNVPKSIINFSSIIGNVLKLPLNSERLNKLTETYIVSNHKIKTHINKPLPSSAIEGLIKTLNSFNKSVK